MSHLRLTPAEHMEKTKLSSKGQVALPRAIREAKAWRAGQILEVVNTCEGVLLKSVKRFEATTLDDVVGCLAYRGRRKSIAELDAAVDAAARGRRN
jgi:bifunctional DNA-binding transcriptional regulator/antitoxin component of YhaV-PrlF toxin-antitoxin module